MPDLIRHPVPSWIPAFAGMTILRYLIAGVIYGLSSVIFQPICSHTETFEKCSVLVKVKEDKNFNHRNILNISRIEI